MQLKHIFIRHRNSFNGLYRKTYLYIRLCNVLKVSNNSYPHDWQWARGRMEALLNFSQLKYILIAMMACKCLRFTVIFWKISPCLLSVESLQVTWKLLLQLAKKQKTSKTSLRILPIPSHTTIWRLHNTVAAHKHLLLQKYQNITCIIRVKTTQAWFILYLTRSDSRIPRH